MGGLRSTSVLIAAATILSVGLAGQTREELTRPAVAFEVASIKPNRALSGFMSISTPDRGNVSFLQMQVSFLFSYAFSLKYSKYDISGSPDWLSYELFDIRAVPPDGAPRNQIPLMMQSLLIDRFKLRDHWETRDRPVYSLERLGSDGPLGPELKPSKHDCTAFWGSGGKGNEPDAPRDEKGRAICDRNSERYFETVVINDGGRPWRDHFAKLSSLADGVGGLDRPIVDNTGLSGAYDIHLEFGALGVIDRLRLPAGVTARPAPDIRDAVQAQLGLKLVPKTGPWKVLVIDSIERPTPD